MTSGGLKKSLKEGKDINLIEIKDDPILNDEILPAMRKNITECLLSYNREHSIVPNHEKLIDLDDDKLLQVMQHGVMVDGSSALAHKWIKQEGFFHWHIDIGPSPLQTSRILVCMFYLNDVDEGGRTQFAYQNIESKPTKGSLVIFPADWMHLHKGEMPISNDKYICNFWVLRKNPLIVRKSKNDKWKHYEYCI